MDWGPMTKQEAKQLFIESYYGDEQNLHRAIKADKLAVKLDWDIFTDMLCRDGNISIKQYESWTFPWSTREEQYADCY
jgi:hypothetical protein